MFSKTTATRRCFCIPITPNCITGQKAVADAIKMQLHVVIDKKKLSMSDIKTAGVTEVIVKVYPEISAKVKVLVEQE